jgi:hypothetical protein
LLLPSPPPPAAAPPAAGIRPRTGLLGSLSWLCGLVGCAQGRYRLLLFRPKKFFDGMTAPRDRNMLAFLAFSIGLASAIGNSEGRIITDIASGQSRNWLLHWLRMIGLGAVGAGFALTLGSYWYRFRLRLAGVKGAELDLVRRVYLSAAQIVAVPVILKSVLYTFVHDTPFAAALADPTWQTRIYLIFPVWSTIAGYVGVRTVFRPRGIRAAILFLIMPGLFYALIALAMFPASGSGIAVAAGPPADVEHPREFASRSMSFTYPGNWTVMKGDPEYDPEANVQIRPVQDARVRLCLIRPTLSSEEAVDASIEANMAIFGALAPAGSFEEWGSYRGAGRSFEGLIKGKAFTVRIFVAPVTVDASLYASEISEKASLDKVQPGLDLIRRSFRCLRD